MNPEIDEYLANTLNGKKLSI